MFSIKSLFNNLFGNSDPIVSEKPKTVSKKPAKPKAVIKTTAEFILPIETPEKKKQSSKYRGVNKRGENKPNKRKRLFQAQFTAEGKTILHERGLPELRAAIAYDLFRTQWHLNNNVKFDYKTLNIVKFKKDFTQSLVDSVVKKYTISKDQEHKIIDGCVTLIVGEPPTISTNKVLIYDA